MYYSHYYKIVEVSLSDVHEYEFLALKLMKHTSVTDAFPVSPM